MQPRVPVGRGSKPEIDMYSAARRVQSIAGQAAGILSAIYAVLYIEDPSLPRRRYGRLIYGVARPRIEQCVQQRFGKYILEKYLRS